MPGEIRELALLCVRMRDAAAQAQSHDGAWLVALLETMDAFRRAERFFELLKVWQVTEADRAPWPPGEHLRAAHKAAQGATLSVADRRDLTGPALGARLREKRILCIDALAASR